MGLATAKRFVQEAMEHVFITGRFRRRFGYALPEKNGDDNWVLPIPATQVIDTDG